MDKKIKGEIENQPLERSAVFAREAIDTDARTVEIAFSSEEPYRRWFGDEVLSHEKGAIDFGFLNSGTAPFLANHNSRDVIGVVEKAWVDKDRKGRALVRFGKSERATEMFNDVTDGIRSNISVGYMVKKWEVNEDPATPIHTAIKWKPLEASLVSLPADETVGVGKSANFNFNNPVEKTERKLETMNEDKTKTEPGVDIEKATADAVKDAREKELERIQAITSMGKRRGFEKDAQEFINTGKPAPLFKDFVWEQEEKQRERIPVETVVEDKDIGLTGKEADNYSFLRMIRAQIDPRQFAEDAAFEIECSTAAAKRSGVSPKGLLVPTDVMRRSLTAGTTTDGAELVATNLMAGSFIDVLRNLSIVMNMGASTLTDLVGDVAIPRKTSGSAAGWITTEGGDAANSEPQFDQVTFSPKTLGVYADATRQLLMQSSIDVENLLRADLAAGMATAIDLAALYGSGTSGQPTGVSNQTGINAPTSFAAAVPTYAEIVAMESAVAVDNALMGTLGYIVEPSMRGSLKTSEKASNTAQFIWEPGNTLNGYKTGVTNQITSGDIFFGNWADLIIAMWGGLDVLADPYTLSLKGSIRIVCHQSIDLGVRHPVSFAYNNDGS